MQIVVGGSSNLNTLSAGSNCDYAYKNFDEHCVHVSDCTLFEADRRKLLNDVHCLSAQVYDFLMSLRREGQSLIFLGNESRHISAQRTCRNYVFRTEILFGINGIR